MSPAIMIVCSHRELYAAQVCRIRANAFVREDLRQPGREILDRPFGRLAGTIDDGADLPIRFTWRLK